MTVKETVVVAAAWDYVGRAVRATTTTTTKADLNDDDDSADVVNDSTSSAYRRDVMAVIVSLAGDGVTTTSSAVVIITAVVVTIGSSLLSAKSSSSSAAAGGTYFEMGCRLVMLLLAAGVATMALRRHETSRTAAWWPPSSSSFLLRRRTASKTSTPVGGGGAAADTSGGGGTEAASATTLRGALYSQAVLMSRWSQQFRTIRRDRLGLWLPSEVRTMRQTLQRLEDVHVSESFQWETSNRRLKEELENETAKHGAFRAESQRRLVQAAEEAQVRHDAALQGERDKVTAIEQQLALTVRQHHDALAALQEENDTKLRMADQQNLVTLQQTTAAMRQAVKHSGDVQHHLEAKVVSLEHACANLHREVHSERAQVEELQDYVAEQEQSHERQVRLLERQLGDVQSCFGRRQELDQKRTAAVHRTGMLEQHVRHRYAEQLLIQLWGATVFTPRERGATGATELLHRSTARATLYVSQLESKTGRDFLGECRNNGSGCNDDVDDEDDEDDNNVTDEENGTKSRDVALIGGGIGSGGPVWDVSWQLDLFWREAWRSTILPLVSSVMFPHPSTITSKQGAGRDAAASAAAAASKDDGGPSPADDDDNDRHADLLAAKTSFLLKNFIARTMGFSSSSFFFASTPLPPPRTTPQAKLS